MLCSVTSVVSDFLWPTDCSPPGSSVHGILQAKILEWVAVPSSRGYSWPRNQTCVSNVSYIIGRFFTHWATWEAHVFFYHNIKKEKTYKRTRKKYRQSSLCIWVKVKSILWVKAVTETKRIDQGWRVAVEWVWSFSFTRWKGYGVIAQQCEYTNTMNCTLKTG